MGRPGRGATVAAVLALLAPVSACDASINADESVLLFPTAAHFADPADSWEIPIHAWVFEAEDDSLWRAALVAQAAALLRLDGQAPENDLFRQRAWMFLVDNERGQTVQLRVGDRDVSIGPTGANGHVQGLVRIGRAELAGVAENGWVAVETVLDAGDPRRFAGAAQLLEPDGVSVISDVDDTIKVSDVADMQALLANTFLREFRPVPGMAALYRRWAGAGVAFHYVSSSPWPLYPALAGFLDAEDFPRGSFHLRTIRLKDESFFNLFQAPEAFKIPTIEGLFNTFPGRRFVLVGDSGERDPEIYGEIARRFPEQIVHVFVRTRPDDTEASARMDAAFAGVPSDLWTVFYDPAELADFSIARRTEAVTW